MGGFLNVEFVVLWGVLPVDIRSVWVGGTWKVFPGLAGRLCRASVLEVEDHLAAERTAQLEVESGARTLFIALMPTKMLNRDCDVGESLR